MNQYSLHDDLLGTLISPDDGILYLLRNMLHIKII
jgi:hypothetical protein